MLVELCKKILDTHTQETMQFLEYEMKVVERVLKRLHEILTLMKCNLFL